MSVEATLARRARQTGLPVGLALVAVWAGLAVGIVTTNVPGASARGEVVVSVDATTVLGPVKPLVFGVNTASWDEQLFPGTMEDWPLTFDQDALRKVKQAGIRFLRFPGGADGDQYVWDSPFNSTLRMDTDEFILFCRLVGAEPSISVNYPAGPELAAEWVRYANEEKGYGVRYWEIGDEEYFSVPASVYARRVVEFVRAMKAVDPTIRVGAGVSVSRATWTLEVLRTAGQAIDFVVYNWFPQNPRQEDDARLLASPAELRQHLRALRGFLRQAVPERADDIEIHIGGYNSVSSYPGPQSVSVVNALWTADVLGVLLEEGVDAAGFWALHNVYPPRGGDYGLLTSTPDNEPNPSYYAFPLFTRYFGTKMVAARSPDELLSAYAALHPEQEALYVVLINKDPVRPRTVKLDIRGFAGQRRAVVRVLSETSRLDTMTPRPDVETGFEVPPYSAVSVMVPAQAESATSEVSVLKATASSSAELGPAWGPASAVDGNPRTRWASRIFRDEPEWLSLELAGVTEVRALRLVWERHAVHYRVELSTDGRSWQTVFETTSGRGGTETVAFPPRQARFVRLQLLRKAEDPDTRTGHSVWTAGAYSLWEISVLGEAGAGAAR